MRTPIARPGTTDTSKQNRSLYRWLIVSACFLCAFTMGETFYSYGVFFKPLESEFGWSRSLTSTGYTTFIVGYAVSAFLSGRLVDRYSPRLMLLPSAALAGIGMAMNSQVQNIDQLRILLLIAGLGSGATFAIPTTVVQQWFHGKAGAGIALGLVSAGIGLGQLVFPPLINHFILSYGWRDAYLITGILFAILIFGSSLFIKKAPPDASPAPSPKEFPKPATASGWTTRQALTSHAFLTLLFINCAWLVVLQTVTVHLVPYATDLSMSSTAAAAALGLFGGMTIPGRVSSGFVSDKLGWQRTMILSMCGIFAALVWLLFLRSAWMIYVFVIPLGVCQGARTVSQWGMIKEFFGLRSLGELIGITTAVSNLVGAVAPFIAGYVYDTTGSYFVAFAIMTGLVLAGTIAIIIVRPPKMKPEVVKQPAV